MIVVTCLLNCRTAHAQQSSEQRNQRSEWVFIAASTIGTNYYVDSQTRVTAGDKVSVWERAVFPDGSFKQTLNRYDCRRRRYQIVQTDVYDRFGILQTSAFGGSSYWEAVAPDTIGDKTFTAACRFVINATTSNSTNTNATKHDRTGTNQNITKLVEVTTENAQLRAADNITGGVLRKLARGEQLELIKVSERANEWL